METPTGRATGGAGQVDPHPSLSELEAQNAELEARLRRIEEVLGTTE